MDIQLAVLADEANVSTHGKLNVLGIFDQINAARVPWTHPRLVFVLRLRANYEDSNRSATVSVRLLDADHGVLFGGQGRVEVPKIQPGKTSSANLVFSLNQMRFKDAGRYHFETTVRYGPDTPPAAENRTHFDVVVRPGAEG